jgi:DNA modification methylase
MSVVTHVKNPKLPPGRSNWYRYYAGFSLDFTREIARSLDVPAGGHVLDPWSGSGTTVLAFAEIGALATGIDANPALVIVGRGRLLPASVKQSLEPIANGVVEIASTADFSMEDDPLSRWFAPATCVLLRRLEWALQHLLVSHADYSTLARTPTLPQVSNLAAFYYVAMFEMVRKLASGFRSSNPTWIRDARPEHLIAKSWDELVVLFRSTVTRLANGLARPSVGTARSRIRTGDSTRLELPDSSIDAVVASPPYCTRLDYVVSTLPELALLGFSTPEVRALRDRMIGTPTIHAPGGAIPHAWGASVRTTLEEIAAHDSKASSTYYARTYWQYFDGMFRSLGELRRVLRPGGDMVLVVQDSYYKDVHVDLPWLLTDMASRAGFELSTRTDFGGRGTWTTLNPRSRRYAKVGAPTESVLTLTAKPKGQHGH